MNVNLTPELERLIQDKVASGLYNNQSEVVREALRLFADQGRRRTEQIEGFRAALAEGLAQAGRGDLLEGDTVVEELRAFLRSRSVLAKKKKKKKA